MTDQTTTAPTREPAPDTESLPDSLFGLTDPLDGADEDESLWSRFMPRDVPFMKMALLDQLVHRPYHAVSLMGPFDLRRLVRDHAKHLFRSETSISRRGKPSIDRLLLVLGDGILGFLDEYGLKLYAPTTAAAAEAARDFRQYVKPPRESKPHFYVVSLSGEGAIAESVAVQRPAPVTQEDLALNYGDGFIEWQEQWLRIVRDRASGVTILHGAPGTRKTSFIRALMSRLLGQAVFFIMPVSEAELLSSPKFVRFWIDETRRHKGRIKFAVMEDSEDLLLPREPGSREKVSSLLNIADGLLGDHLRLHVLATTNVPVSQLDPAIARPGRLAGVREFRCLTRVEAQRLASAKGLSLPDADRITLAQVYSGTGGDCALHNGRKIGFA